MINDIRKFLDKIISYITTINTSTAVMDDWDEADRAKVNVIVGQAGITAGAGAVAANTPRTTHASDDPAVVALGATTDAAVDTDADGTINAHARGLVKLFVNFLSRFPAVLGVSGGLKVDGSGTALPVSGTVTADPTGHTKKVRVVPTVSTTPAYSSGDSVGGKMTFSDLARISGGSGVIMSLTVADFSNQKAELELWLFDQDFTAGTDNAAAAYSAADMANCVGVIPIYASDYKNGSTGRALATVRAIGLPFIASGTANLYGQLVTRGTPTYAAISDIEVVLKALQD